MSNEEPRFASTAVAARHIGVSQSFLEKLRVAGSSCPYIKIGSRVVYDLRELEEWARTRTRRNTANSSAA